MARPREFDEEAALQRAMEAFWSKGFEATSLTDLTEAMGLSRSSVYAAFGDKDQLFARAIDLYMTEISAERVKILRDASSVREGLQDYFDHNIRVALDPRTPAGCFVVNTALEMNAVPPDVAERLNARAKIGETAVRSLLERGQATGEVDRSRDARSLALMIVTLTYGIHVMARMQCDRKKLQAIAGAALNFIL